MITKESTESWTQTGEVDSKSPHNNPSKRPTAHDSCLISWLWNWLCESIVNWESRSGSPSCDTVFLSLLSHQWSTAFSISVSHSFPSLSPLFYFVFCFPIRVCFFWMFFFLFLEGCFWGVGGLLIWVEYWRFCPNPWKLFPNFSLSAIFVVSWGKISSRLLFSPRG